MKPRELFIDTITPEDYLESFCSYEKDLVNFLREDALLHQQERLSVTFIFQCKNEIAAYITLLADKITLEGELKDFFSDKGIPYPSLPAMKIGRICVHDSFLRQGIGKRMIAFAAKIADEVGQVMGCRFLTVDAKHGGVSVFYKKMGFKTMKQIRNTTLMYLDLAK